MIEPRLPDGWIFMWEMDHLAHWSYSTDGLYVYDFSPEEERFLRLYVADSVPA